MPQIPQPRWWLAFGLVIASSAMIDRKTHAADRVDRHPVIPGLERKLSPNPEARPVDQGLILLGELNCTSCHKSSETLATSISNKQAPILDQVGSRVRPEYISAFLNAPDIVKPGTTMPDLLKDFAPSDRKATVQALTHFLSSTGTFSETRPNRKSISDGGRTYHSVGCVACHGSRDNKPVAPGSVPLGELGAKYSIPSLSNFIRDPLLVRPSGRMPGLNLTQPEASDLAQFLLKDMKSDVQPSLMYQYYEGSWDKLPDFSKLNPISTGTCDGFDLSKAIRKNDIAMRFEGYLQIERAGNYRFFLSSDDGSKLYVNDKLVVDNDGIHAPVMKAAGTQLTVGSHKLVVELFNASNEADLTIEVAGPQMRRRDLAGLVSVAPNEGKPSSGGVATRFTTKPELVEKGRQLFATLGCASCHQMKIGNDVVASKIEAKSLQSLTALDAGCLAESTKKSIPYFPLNQAQKAAITTTLKDLKSLETKKATPAQVIAQTMTVMNCYACHSRAERGGVEPERSAYFETTQKEMGDEGRLPPRLDGVGAKLTENYLKQILVDGAKARPYMLTRMPHFGGLGTKPLMAAFLALDTIAPVKALTFEESEKRVKSTGRHLVGSDALSCVKCHTFKGSEAEGIQAIDMTQMTRRLRRDWFHRYVINPPEFRPGTRMPTAWPNGKSVVPHIMGGDTAKQIESVWQFLSDGSNAIEPAGLGRQPMPLFAIGEAVIYRNFIQGAGTRAIGVGYPERGNIAFDANGHRLAMIWQGGFMDASRHWTGRGVGFQPPMGDNVVSLPEGASFASLSSPSNPWPTLDSKSLGYKFKGYRLTADQRPTFLYEFGDNRFEDTPNAVKGKTNSGIDRTIVISSEHPIDTLYFRAAVGETIKLQSDGSYLINGDWKLRLGPDARPSVRAANGKQELIFPVKFQGNKATVVEHFEW